MRGCDFTLPFLGQAWSGLRPSPDTRMPYQGLRMALPRKWHFRLCPAQAFGPSGPCAHPGCLTSGSGTSSIITPFPHLVSTTAAPASRTSLGAGRGCRKPPSPSDGEAGEEEGEGGDSRLLLKMNLKCELGKNLREMGPVSFGPRVRMGKLSALAPSKKCRQVRWTETNGRR